VQTVLTCVFRGRAEEGQSEGGMSPPTSGGEGNGIRTPKPLVRALSIGAREWGRASTEIPLRTVRGFRRAYAPNGLHATGWVTARVLV
jgi:hypothetical protein